MQSGTFTHFFLKCAIVLTLAFTGGLPLLAPSTGLAQYHYFNVPRTYPTNALC